MVIIFKFEMLKECPSRDIATYSKMCTIFAVVQGIVIYHVRHNHDMIVIFIGKFSMT